MKTKTKVLGAIALTLALFAGKAEAAVGNPAYLNIDVTIANNLSVSVIGVKSSTVTQAFTTAGASVQAPSTATVTNDTGYLAERWELSSTASSWDSLTGTAGWTIGTTAGTDTVVVKAVFG